MKFESMFFNFQEIIIRHNASKLMRYLGFVDQLIIAFRRFPRFNAMQMHNTESSGSVDRA